MNDKDKNKEQLLNELQKLHQRISGLEKSEAELKHEVQKAKKQTHLNQQILETTQDGYILADTDGNIIDVNPAYCSMIGYSKKELLNMNIRDLEVKIPAEEVKQRIQQMIQKGKDRFETEHKRKDGHVLQLAASVSIMNIDEKPLVGAFMRDITDFKQAKDTLLMKDYAVDSSINAIGITDLSGVLIYVNEAAVKIWGYDSSDEILGRLLPEFWEGDGIYQTIEALEKDGFRFGEDTARRKDGSIFTVQYSASVVKDKGGNPKYIFGSFIDISKRKQTEVALKESEEKLRNIIENSTNLFYSHTPEHVLTYVSPQTREFFDCEPEEALIRWAEFATENEINKKGFQLTEKAIRTGKRQQSYNLELIGKKGRKIWVEVHEAPVVKDGKTIAMVGALLNITERKQVEEVIHESQRKLNTIINNLPGMAYRCLNDRDYTMKYLSQGCNELTGYIPIELIDNKKISFNDIIHPEDRDYVADEVKKAVDKGKEYELNYRIINKSGDIKWVWERGLEVLDEVTNQHFLEGIIEDVTEKREAESESRKLLHSVEQSPVVVMITDTDGKIEYVNKKFVELTGYSVDEVKGKNPRLLKSGLMPAKVYKDLWHTILSGREWRDELLNRKRNGELYWESASISPIINKQGKITNYVAVKEDITRRKQDEEKLRESEERYRAVIEQSRDCIFLADVESKIILQANLAMQKLLGYTAEEINNVTLYDFIANDKASIERNIEQIINGGHFFIGERKYAKKDGLKVDVEVSASIISYSDKKVMCVVARDITERLLAEKAIRESEEKFRNLAEYSPNMIFINKKGKVVYANKLAEQLSGYSKEEIYSANFDFRNVIDQEYQELIVANFRLHMEGKEVPPAEYKIKTKSGSIIESVINTKLINYEGEESILGILTDITELKQAERKLKESRNLLRNLAERLQMTREEERATVAREIHDDLGQSLTALKMDISWLQKNPMDDGSLNAKLGTMLDLTDSTIKTVKRIASELRPGILDDLGLISAIEWQKDEFEKRFNIKCNLKINKTDVTVGDEISIAVFRIFQETLTNIARHSSASKADIKFDFKANKKLLMEIHDNGIGIDRKMVNSPNSFGLIGMKERVNILKGTMEISGKPSKGTLIKVTIPL